MFRFFASHKHPTTSMLDRNVIAKNLLNSGFVCPVEPSAYLAKQHPLHVESGWIIQTFLKLGKSWLNYTLMQKDR